MRRRTWFLLLILSSFLASTARANDIRTEPADLEAQRNALIRTKLELTERVERLQAKLDERAIDGSSSTELWLLRRAREFVVPEPHGPVSPEVRAVRVVLLLPDGVERLTRLAREASAAGKLYALCGLHARDPEAYQRLHLQLTESREVVRFSESANELAHRRMGKVVALLSENQDMLRRVAEDARLLELGGGPQVSIEERSRRLEGQAQELYPYFYTIVHRDEGARDRAHTALLALGPFAPRATIEGALALLAQSEQAVRDIAMSLLRELEPWAREFMDESIDTLLTLCTDELEPGGIEAGELLGEAAWGWHYADIRVFDEVLTPGGLEERDMFLETIETIRETAAEVLLARGGVLIASEEALRTILVELENGEGIRVTRALLESDKGIDRIESLYQRDDEDLRERLTRSLRASGADGRAVLRRLGANR